MKRCPTCQQTYQDEALGFCTNDGTPLVTEASRSGDLQATLVSSAPPSQSFRAPSAQNYQAAPQSWPQGGQQFAPPSLQPQAKQMTGYYIIGGSLVLAFFLGFIWLVGLIFGIGGGLIHLFLLLAMLTGFAGVVGGLIYMLAVKR
jgi:hypothetical protein